MQTNLKETETRQKIGRIKGEMFQDTRRFLQTLGLPQGDDYSLPSSTKRFSGGEHFGIEVGTVNSIGAVCGLLKESTRLGIRINKITETYGLFRHDAEEIKRYVGTCQEYGCDLYMSTGPRSIYDTSSTIRTSEGIRAGYRLRGTEQVLRAIDDIRRGLDYGVTGFVVYDEGLLWILGEMRKAAVIPSYIKFKISAHVGASNPATFKLLEGLGANSINPVRDLELPMISSLRQAIDVPIDCHTDNPKSSGGFIRVYEAPEMVRVASPVYLKTGNSVLDTHSSYNTEEHGILMARQVSITLEMIRRYFPEAIQLD